MRIDPSIPPSNPYFLSRAYNTPTPGGARPIGKIEPRPEVSSTDPIRPVERVRRDQAGTDEAKLRQIVAGVVPGRVDFSGDTPTPSGAAIPLYRHPADRNMAATSVNVGRALDVRG